MKEKFIQGGGWKERGVVDVSSQRQREIPSSSVLTDLSTSPNKGVCVKI